MTFWLNGEFREDKAAISIADRGFLLGDGVFETFIVMGGRPVFLSAHLRRMRAAAAALGIEAQISDAEIAGAITELVQRNQLADAPAWTRITLSRGTGPRGLDFLKGGWSPTLLITTGTYAPPMDDAPAQVIISHHVRNEHSIGARWKTTNYLDNILAREEAVSNGAEEAVMMNTARRVACGAAANIFLLRNGVVRTPPLHEGAMPGIVRGIVLEGAKRAGVETLVAPIEKSELFGSALFLTNSLIGLRRAALRGARAYNEDASKLFSALKENYDAAVKDDIANFGERPS